MKKIICPSCEEKYNPEDGQEYSDLQEKFICFGCYENDQEHASTIVKYNGQDKETVRFGEYIAFGGEDGEVPEWFWDIFEKREYIHTDGWRGYYQTKFKKGLIKLVDGWVTGFLDETTKYKAGAFDLQGHLNSGAFLPCPLYWLFEPTSNVFSTASEIYVEQGDQAKIEKWLKEHKLSIEDLQKAFS